MAFYRLACIPTGRRGLLLGPRGLDGEEVEVNVAFLAGRVSYERFRVSGRELGSFDSRHVDILDRHAIGRVGAVTADGVEVGFTAGEHLLDLEFDAAKNVVGDSLHFGLRVDSNRIPGDLVRAYAELELARLAAENPSGRPSRQQRNLARQAAKERCLDEARTGRFRRMQHFPVLWDARSGTVLFGSSSMTAIDRFVVLFKEAFGRPLARVTAGSLAHEGASQQGQARALEDLSPAAFTGPSRTGSVAWVTEQYGSRDFLGNEFLLWLWWVFEEQSPTLECSDGTSITGWLCRTLTLECPLAETGKETIQSESPPRLPEAKRAIQAGKLPRKAGLSLSRQGQDHSLTLAAESLSVSSASLPAPQSGPEANEREERIDQVRELVQTVDLLFDVFCRRRLSSQWREDLASIRRWLAKE